MRSFVLFFICFISKKILIINDKKEETKSSTDDYQSEKTEKVVTDNQPTNTTADPVVNLVEKILGSFVGPFGNNKITMLITKAEGDSIAGRTIVGGNNRPFTGTFSKVGSAYVINATEPGDDKDDGAFSFTIDEANTDVVTGSWKPNNKAKPAKEYSLKRRAFEYNPNVGNYPQSSQRLLKAKDVENEMNGLYTYDRKVIKLDRDRVTKANLSTWSIDRMKP